MAEKNLAAFLRDDTFTVGIRYIQDNRNPAFQQPLTLLGADTTFDLSNKVYTYICDIPNIKEGDLVVVYAVGIPKTAIVVRVDETVLIQPNDPVEYKWVVSRINMDDYLENLKKNNEVLQIVRNNYRKNVKASLREMIYNSMDEGGRKLLQDALPSFTTKEVPVAPAVKPTRKRTPTKKV